MAQTGSDPWETQEELSGKTWEEFSEWLLRFREGIRSACHAHLYLEQILEDVEDDIDIGFYFDYLLSLEPYPESWANDNWIKERLYQLSQLNDKEEKEQAWLLKRVPPEEYWLETAREAWEHLGTAQNRLRVLKLLHGAVVEAIGEIRGGTRFRKETKKDRTRTRKALLEARREAERVMDQAIVALRAYRDAATAAERFLLPGSVPELTPESRGRYLAAHTMSDELSERLDKMQEVAGWLKQIADPVLFTKRRGKIGTPMRTTAILGLWDIFTDKRRKTSNNKARIYVHALLFMSGIHPDPEPNNFFREISQLLDRHAR